MHNESRKKKLKNVSNNRQNSHLNKRSFLSTPSREKDDWKQIKKSELQLLRDLQFINKLLCSDETMIILSAQELLNSFFCCNYLMCECVFEINTQHEHFFLRHAFLRSYAIHFCLMRLTKIHQSQRKFDTA